MTAMWVALVTVVGAAIGSIVTQAFGWLSAKRAAQSTDAKAVLEAKTADAKLQVEGAAEVRDLLWQQVVQLQGQVSKLEQRVEQLQDALTRREARIIELEKEVAAKDLLLAEIAAIARTCEHPKDKCPVRLSGILPRIEPTGRFRVPTVPGLVPVPMPTNEEGKKS